MKDQVPTAFLSSIKGDATFHHWHSRLGHPSQIVLSRVLKDCNLPFSIDMFFCSSYCLGKFHQLPFNRYVSIYTKPLELVYFNIWGPFPIPSIIGSRYYIHFTDAFF